MAITRTGTTPGKYTVCTSSTHPSSPAVGDKLFETDTGKELTYQGATDTWTLPWYSDWGNMGAASVASSQSVTTIADVTTLTVTFTAVANRRYKVTGQLLMSGTGVSDQYTLTLADGSNTVKQTWIVSIPVANVVLPLAPIFVVTGLAAGSTTLKYRLARTSGAGTVTNNAGAAFPSTISVDDDGQNGAPS